MTEVLKEKWGHEGFVVADWNAVVQLVNQGMAKDGKEAAMYAINAGLDMDMVDNLYMEHLEALVNEGKVPMERVDDAVRRVLTLKFRLGLFENPYTEEKPEKYAAGRKGKMGGIPLKKRTSWAFWRRTSPGSIWFSARLSRLRHKHTYRKEDTNVERTKRYAH